MSVTLPKLDKTLPAHPVRLSLGTTAISQTAKKVDGVTPGYAFEVVSVEVNATTVAATISVDVQIGATSVLASPITPVAATPTEGTLGTSVRGGAAAAISLLYTSNGTGAATNGFVTVWIRPQVTSSTPIASVP